VAGSATSSHKHATSIKLNVLASASTPQRVKAQDTLTAEFEKAHPGVTIKWQRKSFNDLFATVKLILSGPNSPDIAYLPQGWPMVALVKAGLLVPLDKYEKQYGWDKRFTAGQRREAEASKDGTKFGTGSLYGIPVTTDITGVFYDKKLLASLGQQLPTTFEQFQSDLAAAKQKGLTPIQFGNSDGWPLVHFSYVLQPIFVSKNATRNFVYTGGKSPIPGGGMVTMATTLQSWFTDKYFPDDWSSQSSDDAWKKFANGDGLFYFGGSWLSADIQQIAGKNAGFFLLPRVSAGAPVTTTGSGGNPFAISAKSKNPDMAAAFLNYLSGPRAVKLYISAGDIPAPPFKGTPGKGTVTGDIFASLAKLEKADGMVPWLDWGTTTMFDTLKATLQELAGGQTTPAGDLQAVQDDAKKFQADQGK
jgi:raffinose/stachyose/melibiose transport system substrate-binding protein